MPRYLVLAAVALVITALWRLMRRQMDRVEETLAEVRAPNRVGPGPHLVRGPDGVYRPEPRGRSGV
jgi:hypothetical protein